MVDDDGRTPDHGHPISSPCEPNGSGELKKMSSVSFYSIYYFFFFNHDKGIVILLLCANINT